MKMTKGRSGKDKVTDARVGKTHTPMGKANRQGSGSYKRDDYTNGASPSGGSTKRYRSGDVTVTSTNNNKYK